MVYLGNRLLATAVNYLSGEGDDHYGVTLKVFTIRIWNTATGACERVLRGDKAKGHKTQRSITSMASLGHGWLAAGSNDNLILIWDAVAGTLNKVLKTKQSVSCLASLGAGVLAVGTWELEAGNRVEIWDTNNSGGSNLGRDILLNDRGATPGDGIAMAPISGGRLATTCSASTIQIWALTTGLVERELGMELLDVPDGSDTVRSSRTCLDVLGDGMLVSGSRDGSIRVWDVDGSGACIRKIQGIRFPIMTVCWLGGGRVAAAGRDRSVHLYNVDEEEYEGTLGTAHHQYVYGGRVLAALEPGRLALGTDLHGPLF